MAQNPETWRLLYSNFYQPKGPRFAYTTRRNYMTKKAYAGNCTEARSGSICTDSVGVRCYKIGAGSFDCAGSANDKNLTDDQLKARAKQTGANTGSATPGAVPSSGGGGGGLFGNFDLGGMLKNPMVIVGLGAALVLVVVIAINDRT